MKVINDPDARSVRVTGVGIINSVKTVASVFTEILLFMVWFPAIIYGLYRVVIVSWDDFLKPQSPMELMEFINFMVELYSYVLPSLAVIAVALIVILCSFEVFYKVWRKSC
ncbi:TPA: hypothetical protein ACRVF3_004161 [Escherichia coli]|nr:hypothetical protein [Escherichia coli]